MEHQRWLLSKEMTIEHKHKSVQFLSFSLPNPWFKQPQSKITALQEALNHVNYITKTDTKKALLELTLLL